MFETHLCYNGPYSMQAEILSVDSRMSKAMRCFPRTRSAGAQEVYWRTQLVLKNKHAWVWLLERL